MFCTWLPAVQSWIICLWKCIAADSDPVHSSFCASVHVLHRLYLAPVSELVHCFAEERTTTNPVADDMNACKELYEMTLEIVGQKAPEILKMAMPA